MRRFEAMRGRLAEHGVTLVALSKDSVEKAALNKSRDGLGFTVLSDPELAVIRQYGVEHHKALEFSRGSFSIFGMPFAVGLPSVETMAIPTTLLADESGVIRWIDQADDYRIRSDPDRVLAAVRDVFA